MIYNWGFVVLVALTVARYGPYPSFILGEKELLVGTNIHNYAKSILKVSKSRNDAHRTLKPGICNRHQSDTVLMLTSGRFSERHRRKTNALQITTI